ncbi:hypothetical protein Pan241w_35610 [Gimesia alba]|uniref:Uncharacterized protein n=1 Tax=Gimesia alba TaxID=2527973 RepID=A0A517RHX8_9PLAN|nr:hypothetical protein [Gimesia alba]QDT43460.1 hypothetical protein Pan241w_35610 [Gimesia alba]
MAKKSSTRNTGKKPVKVFRIGFVSASVFVNEVETNLGGREFHSVNIQRSYRDEDETKFTSSFGLAELPQAVRVLQLAQGYIERIEAEVSE